MRIAFGSLTRIVDALAVTEHSGPAPGDGTLTWAKQRVVPAPVSSFAGKMFHPVWASVTSKVAVPDAGSRFFEVPTLDG